MPAHAKTRLTKKSSSRKAVAYVRFNGKKILVTQEKLPKVLKAIGFKDKSLVSWREAMSDLIEGNEAGTVLRGHRLRKGLTQTDLADMINEEQPNISAMENGARTISKEMAKKLGQALNVDYRVFL